MMVGLGLTKGGGATGITTTVFSSAATAKPVPTTTKTTKTAVFVNGESGTGPPRKPSDASRNGGGKTAVAPASSVSSVSKRSQSVQPKTTTTTSISQARSHQNISNGSNSGNGGTGHLQQQQSQNTVLKINIFKKWTFLEQISSVFNPTYFKLYCFQTIDSGSGTARYLNIIANFEYKCLSYVWDRQYC